MTVARLAFSGPSLELFAAAEEAMAQIPPVFPLAATVAVNPWLGQMRQERVDAAARLARAGGGRMFLPRGDIAAMIAAGRVTGADIAAAATAHNLSAESLREAVSRPSNDPAVLPSVADLAMADTGIDWPALIEDRFGLWAAAHFDRGQAFWPAPDGSAFPSWRAFAARDLTPGLAGLSGFATRAEAASPNPQLAFAQACEDLGLKTENAALYFHRLLTSLSGWAQFARHSGWIAARDGGRDTDLFDLLTIRLFWDAALLERGSEALREAWTRTRADFARPVETNEALRIDAALQEAVDRASERWLSDTLATRPDAAVSSGPDIQAAFCIDVRSEVFRRALEASDPGVRTIGFAGFFGLPIAHHRQASDIVEARAPILLRPALTTEGRFSDQADHAERVRLRSVRAWGRFKRAAVSAFAFVEAAGPLYIGKLARDALGHGHADRPAPAPTLDLPLEERIEAAAQVLSAMSLTRDFARLVLIAGHGADVTNMPHASALQCGACGGHAGDVNARVLANLLNETPVREGLSRRGVDIPDGTLFLAGLHDTVSDRVTLFDADPSDGHRADLARLRTALDTTAHLARTERAARLPRGTAANLAARGDDWSELRPEWGLAGCAAFIAAPRGRSAGRDLAGRAFLHDYDWRQDPDAETLELILSAPVVVASWIALQYHGSSVAPEMFGAGNKLLHNVVGGVGVLEGNGGLLRAGLPWQSVHDGEQLRHVPTRLTVAVVAPTDAITAVLSRQPDVKALFDNGWLGLLAMDEDGRVTQRYDRHGWTPVKTEPDADQRAA